MKLNDVFVHSEFIGPTLGEAIEKDPREVFRLQNRGDFKLEDEVRALVKKGIV